MAEPGKKFTILSFVGGGIRGLMSVTILKKLQTHFPDLVRHTDLIAGCSTGSIITSELVAGLPAAEGSPVSLPMARFAISQHWQPGRTFRSLPSGTLPEVRFRSNGASLMTASSAAGCQSDPVILCLEMMMA